MAEEVPWEGQYKLLQDRAVRGGDGKGERRELSVHCIPDWLERGG